MAVYTNACGAIVKTQQSGEACGNLENVHSVLFSTILDWLKAKPNQTPQGSNLSVDYQYVNSQSNLFPFSGE